MRRKQLEAWIGRSSCAGATDAGEGVAPGHWHRPRLPWRPIALPLLDPDAIDAVLLVAAAARDAAPLPEDDRLGPQRAFLPDLAAAVATHEDVVLRGGGGLPAR